MTIGDDIAGRKGRLSAAKRELLAQFARGAEAPSAGARIPRRAGRDDRVLSFAQERLWFLEQMPGSKAAYHVPFALHLRGTLDVDALERALAEIVTRHETLRTNFTSVDGRPVPAIASPGDFALEQIDLRTVPSAQRDDEASRCREAHGQAPFDLEKGSLFKAAVIRIAEDEWHLVLNVHHIAIDGWSFGVLLAELGTLYEAFARGEPSPLDSLVIQYGDFAAWQRAWVDGERLHEHIAYWEQRLEGAPVLQLPADHPRPSLASFKGNSLRMELPADLAAAIEAVGRQERATLSMVLMAALNVLLGRYTQQTDIVVGSAIANRNHHEIEGLIGFFVNSLVIRTDCSGDPTFLELLRRVQSEMLSSYEHQDLPFERLVAHLNPERSSAHNPLFQVSLQVQNTPSRPLVISGLEITRLVELPRTARVDLEVHAGKDGGELALMFTYSTDLFDAHTIARMMQHFRTILEGIVDGPEKRLSMLPMLSEPERRRVLVELNDTATTYRSDRGVHELFEERAGATPEAIAVSFGDETLTYAALDARANRLAHDLRRHGVGPEVPVAICVERGLEMVIGILGILKAGGAYLPLDPDSPRSRLALIVQDADPPVVLTDKRSSATLEGCGARSICLDASEPEEERDVPVLRSDTVPENVAYILYTSGSTGQPKGVAVPHRSLVNHMAWMQRAFPLGPSDRVLQKTPYVFDASVWEFWAPLLAGATLVMARPDGHRDPEYLAECFRRHRITVLQVVPSLLRALLEANALERSKLRRVFCGGEALPRELAERFASCTEARLYNLYGPTEATIDVTCHAFRAEDDGVTVPIGRPIDNVQVYLLDSRMEPVPEGVSGELYVGGDAISRGYPRDAALTAAKFVPDPFGDAGQRLYRTGDLARWLPGGVVEFLGRNDHQVKLRGFRIEPGEIAAVLLSHEAVEETVVMSRPDASGEPRLVGYVVPVKEAAHEQEAEYVQQWRSMYEETYGGLGSDSDPTFNISGWNSSYTGEPIPADEMRGWVEHTVNRVLETKPRRVLEIGCGTGLLLFRVARHCKMYTGTDFSAQALAYVARHLEGSDLSSTVRLEHRAADEFGAADAGAYDTVILNSIVQYFPSVEYLLTVLEGAVRSLDDDGTIFVGDVRSLPLLSTLHASVQLHRASDDEAAGDLQRRVHERVAQEEELVLDPAIFIALAERWPRVAHVEVMPKRGDGENELTKFRYDVRIRVGDKTTVRAEEPPWEKWGDREPASVRDELTRTRPDLLAFCDVPNAHTCGDAWALEVIESGASSPVSELRRGARERSSIAVPAEWWWRLGAEHGYDVQVSWARCGADGRYDVLLTRGGPRPVPMPTIRTRPWVSYGNSPLQAKMTRQLAPRLREHLSNALPDYMVPPSYVMMESLPLTPNGKVDRKALPDPDWYRSRGQNAYEMPRTDAEAQLAEIWGELLGVDRVGLHDDFFEMGGHSLIATQLASRVRRAFNVDLSLQSLFEFTTVATLVEQIETLQWASNGETSADADTTVERGAV